MSLGGGGLSPAGGAPCGERNRFASSASGGRGGGKNGVGGQDGGNAGNLAAIGVAIPLGCRRSAIKKNRQPRTKVAEKLYEPRQIFHHIGM